MQNAGLSTPPAPAVPPEPADPEGPARAVQSGTRGVPTVRGAPVIRVRPAGRPGRSKHRITPPPFCGPVRADALFARAFHGLSWWSSLGRPGVLGVRAGQGELAAGGDRWIWSGALRICMILDLAAPEVQSVATPSLDSLHGSLRSGRRQQQRPPGAGRRMAAAGPRSSGVARGRPQRPCRASRRRAPILQPRRAFVGLLGQGQPGRARAGAGGDCRCSESRGGVTGPLPASRRAWGGRH